MEMESAIPEKIAAVVPNESEEPAKEKDNEDEYDYTKRNEFTSEIFKIEVMNIPLHSGFSVSIIMPNVYKIMIFSHLNLNYFLFQGVRKLLKQRLNLKPNKIKVLSATQSMYAFVNFRYGRFDDSMFHGLIDLCSMAGKEIPVAEIQGFLFTHATFNLIFWLDALAYH